jgi:DNA-binding GntR family transcriptional regulator
MKKTAIAEVVGEEIASTAATNRASDKFILRLPEGMRKHLAEVAEREGRSMNAVAVTALAIYFENEDMLPWSKGYRLSASIETAIKDLVGQLDNQHQELVQLIKKGDAEAAREAIAAAARSKQKIK